MQPEEVEIVPSDESVWEEQPDHDAYLVAGERPEGLTYCLMVKPGISAERLGTARAWAAGLLDRVYEYGMDRALEIDGWQRRSDGDLQLWGRPVVLPHVEF